MNKSMKVARALITYADHALEQPDIQSVVTSNLQVRDVLNLAAMSKAMAMGVERPSMQMEKSLENE